MSGMGLPRGVEHGLGDAHGQRVLRGDAVGEGVRGVQQLVRFHEFGDEPDGEGLLGA